MQIKIKYHADIDRIERIAVGDWIDLYAAEDQRAVLRSDGVAEGGGQLVTNPGRKDVRDLGSDIRFTSSENLYLTV